MSLFPKKVEYSFKKPPSFIG